jgi:glutamyl-tRNA reductase
MSLITLGLSHHKAPLDVRSRVAFADADQPSALTRLRALPGVSEAALVSTCNRTEIMAVAEPTAEPLLVEWWRRERQVESGLIERYLYTHRDLGAVAHSLRVAAGIDSMIVGEPQILGQMKQSYVQAREVAAVGPVLSRLFEHAFAVAKLVRSETRIGAHPVSVAYAAMQLAKRIFADLHEQTALLIGAGEISTLLARHLRGQGIARLIVANRSLERAQKLATSLGGYGIALADLATHLPTADLIVSSTAARGFILERGSMELALAKRKRKPVFMIDLAVPRDLDPKIAELEDVYLYTVDDLRAVVDQNQKLREAAAHQAEVLIDEYAREFGRWLDSRDAGGTIRAIRNRARESRDEVLEKARRKLAAGASPEEVMAYVADTLSNKLLHAPVSRLRRADAVEQALLLSGLKKLFDLPEE